jgi:hypothetical protein
MLHPQLGQKGLQQYKPDGFGLLCIKEECTKLCFSRRGSHQFENCAGNMNNAIDLNRRSISKSTVKEEVATGVTVRIRGTEAQGIRVHIDIEYHVGSAILYFCIGIVCAFSRSSLLASNSR